MIKDIHEPETIEINTFWKGHYDADRRQLLKVSIDQLLFCEFLYNYGFRRFDLEQDNIFVRIIDDRIIKPITITEIQDFVYSWLDLLPEFLDNEGIMTPADIKRKILTGVSFYFNKQRLNYLKPRDGIIFNRDTLKTKYIYYKNGFILVTADRIQFKPYSALNGYVWYSQILHRVYDPGQIMKGRNVVAEFLHFISGSIQSRTKDLRIAIGYFLHDFNDYKIKALLLTDSGLTDDEEANGRTGKTLFCRLIGHMISPDPLDPQYKTYVELNGKNFDTANKHRYADCTIETKLIVLNDLKRNFDVDLIYNDITERVEVDKKGLQSFAIRPKLILTTNKTIRIEERSSRDRFIEFEFSEYFNDTHTPEKEFSQWFFRDWGRRAWNDYDTVMQLCVQEYLKNGSQLNSPEQINLDARKLRENTSPEFLEFIAEVWKPLMNTEYEKTEWYLNFRAGYPDFDNPRFTQRKFTTWFKEFCNHTAGVENYSRATHEKRTATTGYYIFKGVKPGTEKI